MYEAIGCANRRARSGEDERSGHFPRDVSSERISRDVHTHLSTIINIYHSVVLLLHEQQPKKGQNFGIKQVKIYCVLGVPGIRWLQK